MDKRNQENEKPEKTQIDGNWVITFFVLMFIGVVILGKCGL